jgi:hypothetical protein
MRAAAMTAPPVAAATRRRSRSCIASRAMKMAANAPSSPSADGSPSARPRSAPAAVPPVQASQSISPTTRKTRLSKRFVPPPASAQDSSTTSCDSTSRVRTLPRNDCAMVIPIGA